MSRAHTAHTSEYNVASANHEVEYNVAQGGDIYSLASSGGVQNHEVEYNVAQGGDIYSLASNGGVQVRRPSENFAAFFDLSLRSFVDRTPFGFSLRFNQGYAQQAQYETASDGEASYRVVEPEPDATTLLTAAIMGFEGSTAESGTLDAALQKRISIETQSAAPVYMVADGTMSNAVRRHSNA